MDDRPTDPWLKIITITWILPFCLSFFAYFGFFPAYMSRKILFSEQAFLEFNEYGIFKFRILGKELLLMLNHFLSQFPMPSMASAGVHRLLYWEATLPSLYLSYFILNTFFLCLTMTVLYHIANLKCMTFSTHNKFSWLLLLTFYITISQFVVFQYDILSYFFLCCAIYLFLSRQETSKTLCSLVILMVIATLNREGSAIILSFYATLYWLSYGLNENKRFRTLLILTITFLLTYIALRLFYSPTDHRFEFHQYITWETNFGIYPLVSIVFFLSTLYLMASTGPKAKIIGVFLLFSLPYIYMIFYSALLFEIRLWMPLIICLAILTQVDLEQTPFKLKVGKLP